VRGGTIGGFDMITYENWPLQAGKNACLSHNSAYSHTIDPAVDKGDECLGVKKQSAKLDRPLFKILVVNSKGGHGWRDSTASYTLGSKWSFVMFLAGGNSKGRNKRGSRSKGLPGSITTRRGACLTRRREGGPRRAEFKGGNKIEEGEQIRYSDYSTW
jgi:hypothetical protein